MKRRVELVVSEEVSRELRGLGLPLHGEARVAPEAEVGQAAAVVCAAWDTETPFSNNVFTKCHFCGTGLMHRPHAPAKAIKVCVKCANTELKCFL